MAKETGKTKNPITLALAEKKLRNTVWGPRITEKGTMVAERHVYTFNVDPNATKSEIFDSIKFLYKVTPVRVNILNRKARTVTVRGKQGKKAGGRKAYVFLKKGDKIEFV